MDINIADPTFIAAYFQFQMEIRTIVGFHLKHGSNLSFHFSIIVEVQPRSVWNAQFLPTRWKTSDAHHKQFNDCRMWWDDNVDLQGPYSYILNIIILDMRNSTHWSLIQIMVCRPFRVIPQSQPMMTCCKFDPMRTTFNAYYDIKVFCQEHVC